MRGIDVIMDRLGNITHTPLIVIIANFMSRIIKCSIWSDPVFFGPPDPHPDPVK